MRQEAQTAAHFHNAALRGAKLVEHVGPGCGPTPSNHVSDLLEELVEVCPRPVHGEVPDKERGAGRRRGIHSPRAIRRVS